MKTKDIIMYSFAAFFILGFFVLAWFLKDTESQTAKDTMTTLRDGVIIILGYIFGSSMGSASKNDMLHNSTPINSINEEK